MSRIRNLSHLHVIVVDDNTFIRTIVCQMLRAFGITSLAQAGDAADALKFLKYSSVDLIICDYLMQPLDGIDFAKLLRTATDSRNSEVPILMLTGHTVTENIIAARDAGVTELLAKPISAKSLLSRILHIFNSPRPFIRTKAYVGPCRRRSTQEWHGVERRGGRARKSTKVASDGVVVDSGWGLSDKEITELLDPQSGKDK